MFENVLREHDKYFQRVFLFCHQKIIFMVYIRGNVINQDGFKMDLSLSNTKRINILNITERSFPIWRTLANSLIIFVKIATRIVCASFVIAFQPLKIFRLFQKNIMMNLRVNILRGDKARYLVG